MSIHVLKPNIKSVSVSHLLSIFIGFNMTLTASGPLNVILGIIIAQKDNNALRGGTLKQPRPGIERRG